MVNTLHTILLAPVRIRVPREILRARYIEEVADEGQPWGTGRLGTKSATPALGPQEKRQDATCKNDEEID